MSKEYKFIGVIDHKKYGSRVMRLANAAQSLMDVVAPLHDCEINVTMVDGQVSVTYGLIRDAIEDAPAEE